MNEPKFKPGDVVTWRHGPHPDSILYSGTIREATLLPTGQWMYWPHLMTSKVLESDIITLLYRPTPEPVRDPVREAGYPWMHHDDTSFVEDVRDQPVCEAETCRKADRIVALSRLPGVLHDIRETALELDCDDHGIYGICTRALESVGVKL